MCQAESALGAHMRLQVGQMRLGADLHHGVWRHLDDTVWRDWVGRRRGSVGRGSAGEHDKQREQAATKRAPGLAILRTSALTPASNCPHHHSVGRRWPARGRSRPALRSPALALGTTGRCGGSWVSRRPTARQPHLWAALPKRHLWLNIFWGWSWVQIYMYLGDVRL